ncbi:hypothetical protein [Neolewinella antarctica]|uniref:Uncharacterized protein n=1 Tax=Neolewinella antarctica TaxID=442734 RepID=A0ABX0X7X3_9BACT|nr:hypothetical protein [Neolewinella antarctica]NJC24932.1 hypothetical protein [Neolewinella antarctica]
MDLLASNGYRTGRTGKGVSPFQYARTPADSCWRETNAGGPAHNDLQ